MGFFDDLAMGAGLKDRDDDYYERTAQTLGRESQGGSAQREAQYRGSMGMNDGATVGGGQLDKRGGLLPFMEGGGTIGAIARNIGGKGGGKTEQASNSQDLGLGGLQSFLGTRGPAAQSELGNAQMQATLTDNLPGYFDPATREYVPWYVDMFNGGGFNSAGGEDAQAQAALPRQIPPQAQPQAQPQDSASPRLWNDIAPSYAQEPYSGGGIISNSQMNQEMYGYDYPTEFLLGAEPESLLSLERPFGSRVVPSITAGPSSQPSDRAIQRDMPAYPAQVFGVVGSDANMGRQVNPIPQVDAAEFQRFRSKYEDLLKLNRQWGFPDREADAFQALKASGGNY